jgi:hypothetical protein
MIIYCSPDSALNKNNNTNGDSADMQPLIIIIVVDPCDTRVDI